MKAYLQECLLRVLSRLPGVPAEFIPEFQAPARPEHGDLATNAALQLAKPLRKAPRAIADEIANELAQLPLDPERITAIEVAGPGFLNFRFSNRYLYTELHSLLSADAAFGKTEGGKGKRALVEYVSANPTGPLTVGHGRNTVLGDTIANLLAWTGYEVEREYYFNDAGRQMRILGESVRARYLALLDPSLPTRLMQTGEEPAILVPEPFPDDGYLGDYIIDIAQSLVEQHGDTLRDAPSEEPFKIAAEEAIFADIETTMRRLGVRMDRYFNEHSLYTSGAIWNALDRLRSAGLVYDLQGAVWFKTTDFGKEKDTVLVKSTGEPTYRLPDIAYHVDKLDRGYDLVFDIFGADHIATYPDVLSGITALGYDGSRIEVLIYQFVTLVRSGSPVKMSTRKATYVTLDELMDEVGEDVTRFFFLMRAPGTHLEFDLDLAREASEKNPVFYLQYAHARICSILRKAGEVGFLEEAEPDFGQLTHPSEIDLLKTLVDFPGAVIRAAELREPHRLATYLREVAAAFSLFYRDCRILGEQQNLAAARMGLARGARIVLRNGLTILGVSTPEQM